MLTVPVVKVTELNGAQLDYWVGRAEGHFDYGTDLIGANTTAPFSTDWAHGGPIIEREEIGLERHSDAWSAQTGGWPGKQFVSTEGTTPLIAAMRCYVASKFGTEVPSEAPGL